MNDLIKIAGIVPFTTIDYPNCLSAVLFCQGCAWRCHYCHNPHLQPFSSEGGYNWNDVWRFLSERRHFLDAVVFSGGDPLLQKNLKQALLQVKDLGLKVALHTAGMHPKQLENVLEDLDWVGMDIKAPFSSYEKITCLPQSGKRAKLSAELVIASGVEYEFRTTVHPKLLSSEDLFLLANDLKRLNAQTFVLQKFRATGCVDSLLAENVPVFFSERLISYLRSSFLKFQVRD